MIVRWTAIFALLLVSAALRAEPLGSDEELITLADRVVVAQVIRVEPGQGREQPDKVVLEVQENLLGTGNKVLVVFYFGRLFDRAPPPAKSKTLAFLRRTDGGWFPVRLDGFRSLQERERMASLVAVRRTPHLFLGSSQTNLVLTALEFLKPKAEHRQKLLELLDHPDSRVAVKAAGRLAKLDPRTAGDWLFARWSPADSQQFLVIHRLVSELLGRSLYVVLDTPEDRQRAIELHRLAWWLASPEEQKKALRRLPEVADKLHTDESAWALEALALYPPSRIIGPLGDVLTELDEQQVGRGLAILSQSLLHPGLTSVLAGPQGDKLRTALQTLKVKKFEEPSLRAFIPAEARRLLHRLENYPGVQEGARRSP